jgi:hypothetical protein
VRESLKYNTRKKKISLAPIPTIIMVDIGIKLFHLMWGISVFRILYKKRNSRFLMGMRDEIKAIATFLAPGIRR